MTRTAENPTFIPDVCMGLKSCQKKKKKIMSVLLSAFLSCLNKDNGIKKKDEIAFLSKRNLYEIM